MPVVFVPAELRKLTGGEMRFDLPGATVGELLDALERRCPGVKDRLCSGGQLRSTLQVSIDDKLSALGTGAPVAADSEVHFIPVLGGG